MIGISDLARECEYGMHIAYPRSKHVKQVMKDDIVICSTFWNRVNQKLACFTGFNGCFACISTWLFLRKLNKIKPDLLHFHNLHDSYINLPMLFNYVKKHKIKVVWTLHDCWAFTGHCPYFTLAKCDKWKTGCGNCPQKNIYPKTYLDTTSFMWKKKREWFTGIENLTIVTPSQWLADLVKQSFLKDYPVKVINNGIDLEIFKPTDSDFRKKYHLEDKYIVLGVAFGWGIRKGLDAFIELAQRLDERFQIVLVGTDDKVDQQLPSNIISIHRTHNQQELAEIYSAVDIFVNPTREEVFGLVNAETLACGTPIVTFKTGGCPEIINEKSGVVVDVDDVNEMERQIVRICTEKVFSSEDCVERAKIFDQNKKFMEYVKLYDDLIN
jgi:glycosyltransferase involved in cell wall biosynthesis